MGLFRYITLLLADARKEGRNEIGLTRRRRRFIANNNKMIIYRDIHQHREGFS